MELGLGHGRLDIELWGVTKLPAGGSPGPHLLTLSPWVPVGASASHATSILTASLLHSPLPSKRQKEPAMMIL